MSNIFDYMDWRDISLEKVEFNEVDNLILSRLSYFPFDGIVDKDEITINEAYSKLQTQGTTGRILQEEDIDLYPKLANSERFGKLKLTDFVNNVVPSDQKQFSAITILLPSDIMYVAYRGTDNTIIGWKEDFNMSFSDVVASQIEAKDYLNYISKKYPNKKMLVGGHSKGGNLAMYAAVFCEPSIQQNIIKVYNNDGPGFSENVIKTKEYKKMLKKIHTYMPQTSIIGRLLNHKESVTTVKSKQVGIMQHDVYSWQVLGDKFVRTETTKSSEIIDKTITNWVASVSVQQREEFIDILYEILNATDAKTMSEINNNKLASAKKMITTYKNLDPESKKIIIQTIKLLGANH